MIKIYTDGACSGNPGKGGWGFLIVKDDKVIHTDNGFYITTTNNKMELIAIIKALSYCIDNKINDIELFSDSKYCLDGITKWMKSWEKTNFKNGKLKNKNLWFVLNKLSKQLNINWNWVKGHNENKYNEFADALATRYKMY